MALRGGASSPRFAIDAQGLADLRRSFARIDKELKRELDRDLRAIGHGVRDEARTLLRGRSKNPQGVIERTIRTSVTARGVSVYSNHPGSGVINWGGEIAPRGTPIRIAGKQFLNDAADEHMSRVEEQMGELLDRVAQRNGFH